MDESMWFCNEWDCKYRKNEQHKATSLCDNVWNDECPYDDKFYKSLNTKRSD